MTMLQIYTYAKHLRILAMWVILHSTPAATWDIGLYNLMQMTGTHVPVEFEPTTEGSADLYVA
jgi:hypothetical protein